jgi:hypothetical protein
MRWLPVLLARLGTRTLVALIGVLFLVDVLLPDPLPFVDEVLLGVATLLAARWRQRSPGAR